MDLVKRKLKRLKVLYRQLVNTGYDLRSSNLHTTHWMRSFERRDVHQVVWSESVNK